MPGLTRHAAGPPQLVADPAVLAQPGFFPMLRAQRVISRPWFLALFGQAELLEQEELVLAGLHRILSDGCGVSGRRPRLLPLRHGLGNGDARILRRRRRRDALDLGRGGRPAGGCRRGRRVVLAPVRGRSAASRTATPAPPPPLQRRERMRHWRDSLRFARDRLLPSGTGPRHRPPPLQPSAANTAEGVFLRTGAGRGSDGDGNHDTGGSLGASAAAESPAELRVTAGSVTVEAKSSPEGVGRAATNGVVAVWARVASRSCSLAGTPGCCCR